MTEPSDLVTSMMSLEQMKDAVLAFISANQAWAPPIVALLAFGESLAVLSVLIPATVILFGVGVLIGTGAIPFWPAWTGAVVGAFLGDWVSYEVSRWIGPSIQQSWPLNKRPDLITRTEDLMKRYGAWGVFVGRFFGPLRALVPLVAGVFEMPRLRFQIANLASALVWATGLLLPGAGLMSWMRG